MADIKFRSVGGWSKYLHLSFCMLVIFGLIITVGNFQFFVSKQTFSQWDKGSPVLVRFLTNIAVLGVFILQHSLMATAWFKTKLAIWLNITVSERLVYVSCTCVTLMFLILKWQAIPETFLWIVEMQERYLLWLFFTLLHMLCWFLLGLEVCLVDVGEMVGFSQVYQYYNSASPPLAKAPRKLIEIYSRMRHPGVVLLTIMLWIHPLMTLDRLILTCTLTSYVIGRHSLEESHYAFAEKYLKFDYSQRRSLTSRRYKLVHEDQSYSANSD